MSKRSTIYAVVILLLACLQPAKPAVSELDEGHDAYADFALSLETVRQSLKIPGMSAAVVQDQQLIWARGFGYADVEKGVAAAEDTPYGLASVTKPIAATLIMQLVEEGVVDLDAPVSEYGVQIEAEGVVTVRHLLTHTSEGIPGTSHNYNGNRYGLLGGVIEGATGQSFADLLSERLLLPLEMKNSALNPINSWGSVTETSWEQFKSTFGLGDLYGHYPDVYARLSRPYQFDDQYEIIPGKYHLHHNPAAGLLSSVTDIAAFDIALDQGALVSDAVKSEMFAPAYSTLSGRQGLMYGLGWYVQQYEGLQLLWHAGRWPPSTSALYVKVPEMELTFVILANTDNLTVPFNSIGNGDVSKSLPFLTFFRHFVFPEQHGYAPPPVDWQQSEGLLAAQLRDVEDEASRVFLERELWSYRQAFAGAGRQELADQLERVNRQAFPLSRFRRDSLFTATAGPPQVLPPVIRASQLVWLTRMTILWLFVVLMSVGWMFSRLVRSREPALWRWFIWLLATLLLGPMALLISALLNRQPGAPPLARWRQAVGASCFSISGYALAWVFVITLLLSAGDNPHPLITLGTAYFVPLLVGLLLVRIPSLSSHVEGGLGKFARHGLLSEIITFNVGFAVLFPLTMLVQDQFLSIIPSPTNPYFGTMISLFALVGLLALYPLHYGLSRRGYTVWPGGEMERGDGSLTLPAFRDSWWILLITLGVMVGALAWTIVRLG